MTPTRGVASIRSFSHKNSLHRLEQIHQIDPDRPVAHIPCVHGHALFIGRIAASVHLPDPCDAGRHHVVFADAVAIILDLFFHNGTRPDKAHIAQEDVPQLRQLIEARSAEESAELCDARIVRELERFLPFLSRLGVLGEVLFQAFLCIGHHGLKLVAGKEFAVLPYAPMREDDPAPVVDTHDDSQEQQGRQDQQAAADDSGQIEDPFRPEIPLARQIVADVEHEHLFREKGFYSHIAEREHHEVRHEGDVADKRLDLRDQALQASWSHARRRDDHRLDSCGADDFCGIRQFPHQQELLRQLLRDRVVVKDAYDLVAIAQVSVKEGQHLLRRLPGADEDDGLSQKPHRFQELHDDVARSIDIQQSKAAEENDIEPRRQQTRLHEVEHEDAGDERIEDGIEDLTHGLQDRLHRRIGLLDAEEGDEHQGYPEKDVGIHLIVRILQKEGIKVVQGEGHLLGKQDSKIVGEYKKKRGADPSNRCRQLHTHESPLFACVYFI